MDMINKTQLYIEKAEERGIIHRDYGAHFFRWSFALNFVERDMKILDLGSGDGMLAQVLYVNKYKPSEYIAIDIKDKTLDIVKSRKTNFPIRAICQDVRKQKLPFNDKYFDRIFCFEMIEHFEKDYLPFVLSEVNRVLKDDGIFLLSTPNYDGIHKAANHIHEYTEEELEIILKQFFNIKNKFGTFASKSDIYPKLTIEERSIYDKLHKYYDSNAMSTIFAPLYPSQSRNILWVMNKYTLFTKGSLYDFKV